MNTWQKYVEEIFETRNRPTILDIENETDISEDQKGFPILMDEVELAIKEMKNGEATRVHGIPIDLVKCLGEGKKEFLSLCNKIYKEGEWSKEFTETVLLPIPNKNNAKKCKEFRTISMISHTAKIILRILNRRLHSKMKEELEEQFGFRKGKATRDAIGLIRTIGERYIEKDKDVCTIFVDLGKAFDGVVWKKLMGNLNKICVDLYMKQQIKVRIGEELSEGREIGRGYDKDVLHRLHSSTSTWKT